MKQVSDEIQDEAKQANDNTDKTEQDDAMAGATLQTPVTENVMKYSPIKKNII